MLKKMCVVDPVTTTCDRTLLLPVTSECHETHGPPLFYDSAQGGTEQGALPFAVAKIALEKKCVDQFNSRPARVHCLLVCARENTAY